MSARVSGDGGRASERAGERDDHGEVEDDGITEMRMTMNVVECVRVCGLRNVLR